MATLWRSRQRCEIRLIRPPVRCCTRPADIAGPVGEFLAEVAAGPVYRLLGKKDLGVTKLPPLDTPVISGDLGWHYHTGGHMATPADWGAFLQFLAKYFNV